MFDLDSSLMVIAGLFDQDHFLPQPDVEFPQNFPQGSLGAEMRPASGLDFAYLASGAGRLVGHGNDHDPNEGDFGTLEEEPDVIVVGRRYLDYDGDVPRWVSVGDGDGGYGGEAGGGSGTGGATPAAPHTQDCTTEDDAAVQVAKHVIGELPAGISGPPSPVLSSGGADWTQVEFGAVIVRNPDGTFGALNDMIYSSNQALYATLPSSVGQPVQGLWHSHPVRGGGDDGQQLIDRYPSMDDWASLASVGSQSGAVSNPSLWLTGPDGITREFKLSDRESYEGLGVEAMKAGQGLDGTERSQSCG